MIRKKYPKGNRKGPAGRASRKPSRSKTTRPAARSKVAARPKMNPEKVVEGGTLLGFVDDYFSHVGVMALKLLKPLAVGDTIRVKGHTTDLIQKVESMQIEHQGVQTASPGDSIGIKVADTARKADAVYKI